ncbi:MAG: hypothetical protein PHS79_04010 [Patescibacteria group bacterium]|nr:hypothetical protein [Patescibacteria group bacterium]
MKSPVDLDGLERYAQRSRKVLEEELRGIGTPSEKNGDLPLDDIDILIDAVSNTVLIYIVTETSSDKRAALIRRSRADLKHCRKLLDETSGELPFRVFRINAIEDFLAILELPRPLETKFEREAAGRLMITLELIRALQTSHSQL